MTNNNFKSKCSLLLPISIGLIVFVCLWHGLSLLYDPYILPSPREVYQRYHQLIRDSNVLLSHFWVTFSEAFGGFLIGAIVALPLGYSMYRYPFLDRLLTPFIVGIQAIPIMALAPLLVIWFGFGITSKLLIAALVTFFPVVTNTVIGLKETDPRLRELLQIMGATPAEIFLKLDVPASLPILFGGLKVGMTLSVIGAVVGEFSGSGKGLGYLVNLAKGIFDTPLIFVALIALALLGLLFYFIITLIEHWLMPWKQQN